MAGKEKLEKNGWLRLYAGSIGYKIQKTFTNPENL